MSLTSDRAELGQMIEQLCASWTSGDLTSLATMLATDATLIGNQHGAFTGAEAIASALALDTKGGSFGARTSNLYIGVKDDAAAASIYLFGLMQGDDRSLLLLGATLVMRFTRSCDRWLFTEIRLAINWTQGDTTLAPHWPAPPSVRGWQPGDAPPVIVSELHAPWVILPDAAMPERLEDALPELYFRYAFAVDQNDVGLLLERLSSRLVHAGPDPRVRHRQRHGLEHRCP